MRTGDIIAVVVYLVSMVGLAIWTSRRARTTEGYFVASRSMPGWAVGISMLGTAISSVTFLAYPGSAFSEDWRLLVPGLFLPVAAIIGMMYFVPFFRRSRAVTAFEFLERRYGTWARVYGCVLFSVMSAYRMGSILYLVSLAVLTLLWNDLDGAERQTRFDMIIIAAGVFVTFYTVLGGIEAVIWTDVVQTLILITGGIVCVAKVLFTYPDGPGAVFSGAWEQGKFGLTVTFKASLYEKTFWVLMLNGLIGFIQEFAIDQTKIQRYCAARTTGEARRSVIVGGIGCIPVWSLFMLVGTCMFMYYQAFPKLLPSGVAGDQVFPHFIVTQLPVGLGGLVLAAVLAAAMSSLDSSMNGTATTLTSDLYRHLLVKDRSDRHYLGVARGLSVAAGILMMLSAMGLARIADPSILELLLKLGGVFAGALGGLVFLGFLFPRANGRGAAIGLFVAVAFIVYATFIDLHAPFMSFLPEKLRPPIHGLIIGVVGNVIALALGYVMSLCFRSKPREELKGLTFWT